MKLLKYIKEKKLGLSIYLSLFILLVVSLVFRNIKPDLYPVSVFLMSLVFISSQYFDFEYRYFIGFALILLVTCPFLLIAKYETLAEYFANYVYGFLVLGIIGYFLDNLREKIKKKGYFKIYKIIFLSILILLMASNVFVYRDYTLKVPINMYIKKFHKEVYYSKKDEVVLDGKILKEGIIINVNEPEENSKVSGEVEIIGWAIESNSNDDSGIDEIEFFMDGKPGKGKYLGIVDNDMEKINPVIAGFVTNLYGKCYNEQPDSGDISYWVYKLQWGAVTYLDVARTFFKSKEFKDRNLNNKDYLSLLYEGILNRKSDTTGFNTWISQLNSGLGRDVVLESFLASDEAKEIFKGYNSELKRNIVPGKFLVEDLAKAYGRQFIMGGFIFKFDSLEFENGKHTIYVYAHNPYFGWDSRDFEIYIDN